MNGNGRIHYLFISEYNVEYGVSSPLSPPLVLSSSLLTYFFFLHLWFPLIIFLSSSTLDPSFPPLRTPWISDPFSHETQSLTKALHTLLNLSISLPLFSKSLWARMSTSPSVGGKISKCMYTASMRNLRRLLLASLVRWFHSLSKGSIRQITQHMKFTSAILHNIFLDYFYIFK